MAGEQMKPVASLLLFLNFCMYVIVVCIGGWATNIAIDRGFIIGNCSLEFYSPMIFLPLMTQLKTFFNVSKT